MVSFQAAGASPDARRTSPRQMAALPESLPSKPDSTPPLIGRSAALRLVQQEIEYAARSDAKVLITGASGVGKEVVAHLIHSAQPPPSRADADHQLRGDARHAARVRALRPRPRQLHRRLSRQARPVRVGQRRHRVHGRSRRDVAAHAGAAAPLPRDRRDPARRRRAQPRQRQRARRRRHQPAAARADPVRRLPRGPVLPAQRHPHHDPAAQGSPRRRRAAAAALPLAVRPRARRVAADLFARRGRRARGSTTGLATCASCATSPSG